MVGLLSGINWGRVMIAGVGTHVLWNVALVLGPAGRVGPWVVPVLVLPTTALAAAWVAQCKKASGTSDLHGLLTGLVAGLIGLTFSVGANPSPLGASALVVFALTIAAGWAGAALGGL